MGYFSEVTLGELYYGAERSQKKAEQWEKIVFLKRLFEPVEVEAGLAGIWRDVVEASPGRQALERP